MDAYERFLQAKQDWLEAKRDLQDTYEKFTVWVTVMVCTVVICMLCAAGVAAYFEIQHQKEQATKRYTVQTTSGEYRDLKRTTSGTHWAGYKLPTGGTIIFNGEFTEIEQ